MASNMEISITSGVGCGATQLASFDKALNNAGISDFNLIYLSSIIPPGSKVNITKPKIRNGENYGKRLYCVMARNTEINPEKEAWAGIGWAQAKDGRGIFVEHIGSSEEEVSGLIVKTIDDMKKYHAEKFGKTQKLIRGTKCEGIYASVVVTAIYKFEEWN